MRTVLILLVAAAPGLGQAGKAELFGTILDPSGLAVPAAQVQAEDQATKVRFAASTNERGEYHLLGLPAGEYVVTVEREGFRTYQRAGITLRMAD